MEVSLWTRKFIFGITSLSIITMIGCKKDYYSQIMAEGTCEKGVRELTPACRSSIQRNAPVDVDSFQNHQELLETLLQGLHILLVAPMQLSLEKKFMGVATLKELEMNDFIEHFASNPGANLNQLFVNFLLNSIPKIQYGCSLLKASNYDVIAINVCETLTYVGYSRFDAIEGARFLFHEARHATRGWHDAHCPPGLIYTKFPGDFVYECNKGMDLVYGWEVGFLWALLHGIQDQVPGRDPFWYSWEQDALVSTLLGRLGFVLLAPPPMDPFVGPSSTSVSNRAAY